MERSFWHTSFIQTCLTGKARWERSVSWSRSEKLRPRTALEAGSLERLDQSDGRHRAPSIPSIAARQTSFRRRQPRELDLDEFEIVLDRVEVAAGLVDLAQRERAIVWHAVGSEVFTSIRHMSLTPRRKFSLACCATGYSLVGSTSSRVKAWAWIGVGVATRVKLYA